MAKGLQEYEQQHHDRQVRSRKRKAQDLGYELTERQAAEPKEAKEQVESGSSQVSKGGRAQLLPVARAPHPTPNRTSRSMFLGSVWVTS